LGITRFVVVDGVAGGDSGKAAAVKREKGATSKHRLDGTFAKAQSCLISSLHSGFGPQSYLTS
jgi:hypothetical protein